MNKLLIFAVLDLCTAIYMKPVYADTVESGIRMFKLLVNNRETMVNQFPEDYALFQIGEFDQKTGDVLSIKPHLVSRASEVLAGERGPDKATVKAAIAAEFDSHKRGESSDA